MSDTRDSSEHINFQFYKPYSETLKERVAPSPSVQNYEQKIDAEIASVRETLKTQNLDTLQNQFAPLSDYERDCAALKKQFATFNFAQ